jgi:hypothetical protein
MTAVTLGQMNIGHRLAKLAFMASELFGVGWA